MVETAVKIRNLEQALIDQCKAGQTEAQRELYERYARSMYNICTRMLGNPADAKDAMQDAFIDCFRNIEKFEGQSTFGAWLRRIVVNRCITMLNKRKKLNWVSLDERLDPADLSTDAEANVEYSAEMVNNAIKKLPTKARAVFTLFCLEGYDHEEIASILNVSKGTSKSQYNRARQLLRDFLQLQKT
jgi:RNA polymerase sigma factor (sigma-70 family)